LRISTVYRGTNWMYAEWLNMLSNDVFNTLGPVTFLKTGSPLIQVDPASGITMSSATLNGTLTATGGSPTEVFVYFGANDAGTVKAAWDLETPLGTVTGIPPVAYAPNISGLSTGTCYFYRFYATNSAGDAWSAAEPVLTLGLPVVDNAGGATALGPGTATLNGQFLTKNFGDVTIYWGPADGGTNATNWANALALGPVASSNFSGVITGTTYGVPYVYRAYATNLGGEGWATNASLFKTDLPPAVDLTNGIATSIETTQAVIHATLTAPGAVFDVIAYWGPTDGGTTGLLWSNSLFVGTFTNLTTNLSALATNLTFDNTYYFTFRATNCAGDVWAVPSRLFHSKGVPVVDNDGGAQVAAPYQANLRGNLTRGGEAAVMIYYGLNDGGTDAAMWDASVSLGTQLEGFHVETVTGLIYGLEYHYRFFATNEFGGAWANSSTNFKVIPAPGYEGRGLQVREFDTLSGVGLLSPVSLLQAGPDDGIEILNGPIDYNADFVASFAFITSPNTFSLLWEGWFMPTNSGMYTFGLDHDDRAMLAIDLDGDGDFDDGSNYDPGELVVNGLGGNGTQVGSVNLQNRPYRIAIGFEQGGGGRRITARWGEGAFTPAQFAAMNLIDGISGRFTDLNSFAVGVSNQPPASVTVTTAVLRAELSADRSVFDVDVFWGPNDGRNDIFSWSNTASLGWFTNISQT
ncbi:MAG: PA14 domain-containing protein, partial [Verrucomicrobiota bacterium]